MAMGFVSNLFGAKESAQLFQLNNFEANYVLTVSNEFIMGQNNEAISLQTVSNIFLQQIVTQAGVNTSITTHSITGNTDNSTMQPHLHQAILLGGISKKIDFARNRKGKITSIENKKQLLSEWLVWKKNILPALYPEKTEQVKFVKNYEMGLELLEKNIQNNLHHFILSPDIYHIKNHVSNSNANGTSELILLSRLIKGMQIRYKFITEYVQNAGHATIKLTAQLLNKGEMQQQYLKKLYKVQNEFTLADYDFTVDVDYLMEPNTGKIISGNLLLKEKMHDNLQYILNMQVAEAVDEKSAIRHDEGSLKKKRNFLGDGII
jgi:hypothetical protein